MQGDLALNIALNQTKKPYLGALLINTNIEKRTFSLWLNILFLRL